MTREEYNDLVQLGSRLWKISREQSDLNRQLSLALQSFGVDTDKLSAIGDRPEECSELLTDLEYGDGDYKEIMKEWKSTLEKYMEE